MRRIMPVIASLLAGLALLLQASTAQAAGVYPKFGKIQYDSPGSDTGSNASLNAEYITIKNPHSVRLYLAGYTLHDRAGHTYTFKSNVSIAPGNFLRLHTGSGTDTWSDKYWGRGWYVWNNNGDTAHLHNPLGTLRDACTWPGGSPGYIYC
jgi:hypothetical protein